MPCRLRDLSPQSLTQSHGVSGLEQQLHTQHQVWAARENELLVQLEAARLELSTLRSSRSDAEKRARTAVDTAEELRQLLITTQRQLQDTERELQHSNDSHKRSPLWHHRLNRCPAARSLFRYRVYPLGRSSNIKSGRPTRARCTSSLWTGWSARTPL